MARWVVSPLILFTFLWSCSEDPAGEPSAPDDVALHFVGGGPDAADAVASGDPAEPPGDGETGPSDPGPVNTVPTFAKLAPLTLDMGTSTTVDVNEQIGDATDDDASLVLSWSSTRVALADGGDHRLTVVAPTTWSGTEIIELYVTDTGGLTATQNLTVQVLPVEAPPPVTDPDPGRDPDPQPPCGLVTFSHHAPGAATVIVAGGFNNWGGDAGSGWLMVDPQGDGTWEYDAVLQPGKWQYKFVVDGAWIPDPSNPNQADDGFGGANSVIEVPPCDG